MRWPAGCPKLKRPLPTSPPRPAWLIVGRPNVGKSSLLNRLAGEERALVSEIPGTTRDAVDTTIEVDGREVLLVDTAGLRRRGRVKPGVERYAVLRSLSSVRRADVCLLILDATEGATDQDAHIGGYVVDNYRGLVILANKWDLVEGDEYAERNAEESMKFRFSFVGHAPVLRISALAGMNVEKILPAALKVDVGRRFYGHDRPAEPVSEPVGRPATAPEPRRATGAISVWHPDRQSPTHVRAVLQRPPADPEKLCALSGEWVERGVRPPRNSG